MIEPTSSSQMSAMQRFRRAPLCDPNILTTIAAFLPTGREVIDKESVKSLLRFYLHDVLSHAILRNNDAWSACKREILHFNQQPKFFQKMVTQGCEITPRILSIVGSTIQSEATTSFKMDEGFWDVDVFQRFPNISQLSTQSVGDISFLTQAVPGILPKVRKLDISRLSPDGRIYYAHPAQMAEKMPNLQNLNLSGNPKLEDEHIFSIGEHMKNLRELDIRGCPNITEAALEPLEKKGVKIIRS